MSSPTKQRGKKSNNNKKKNKQNMQQRKKGKSNQKGSKSKNKKKNKNGLLKRNLCYGIAIILVLLIGFIFYYYNNNINKNKTITIIEETLDLTHLNDKFPSIETKYDHSIASQNTKLAQSEFDKEAPNPILFKLPQILRVWNHDKDDFTQGFEVFNIDENGKLIILESTGLYGKSKLKYIELEINNNDKSTQSLPNVQKKVDLKKNYFGEGCTLYYDPLTGNKLIYQLTWKLRKVIIYDLEFNKIKEIDLPKQMKEGWGIYYDFRKKEFIATDGTANIYFIEPNEFKVIKTIRVRYMNNDREGKDHKIISLTNLNEIEIVNGWILANVWYNTNIYIISPFNGFVYGIIECWKIFPHSVRRLHHAVLNGIGFDSVNNQLIITGKNWPKIYAIEVPQFIVDKS